MPKIFLSHSKRDEEIRDYFLKLCGLAGVEGKAIEFEYFPPPPWSFIKDQLTSSDALFLLLGPNVLRDWDRERGIYTQNWISFEVGLACQLDRPIWVFEQLQTPIHFPIPYFNFYMQYDPKSREDFDYIRQILVGYKLLRLGMGPKGYQITCPHETCRITFRLHPSKRVIERGKEKSFNCPSCRKVITF